MLCGRCCVTEPPTKLALRLDIFIEILPRTSVNKSIRGKRCPFENFYSYLSPPCNLVVSSIVSVGCFPVASTDYRVGRAVPSAAWPFLWKIRTRLAYARWLGALCR